MPACGLNTFTRGVQKAAKSSGQVPDLELLNDGFRFVATSAENVLVFSLQWRDRAGFSPASLFFRWSAEYSETFTKKIV